MATRKYGATTRSPTAPRAPPQRNFSSILPNLPIQFSGRLLANARPQSLDEREVLFRAGDVADGCYRLGHGPLKVSSASPHGRRANPNEPLPALDRRRTLGHRLAAASGAPARPH